VHLNQSVSGGANSITAVVDGDGNGQITIADLTPLGANLGNRVAEYNVYVSANAADYPTGNTAASTIAAAQTVVFNTATGDKTTQRLQFGFVVPGPQPTDIYWVRPSDGTVEGTPSNKASAGSAGNVAPVASIELCPFSGPAPFTAEA